MSKIKDKDLINLLIEQDRIKKQCGFINGQAANTAIEIINSSKSK